MPVVPSSAAGWVTETESYLIDIVLLQPRFCKKVDALRSSPHFFIGNQPKIDIFDTREPGRIDPIFREVNNSRFITRFEGPDQYSWDNLFHSIYGHNKRGFVAHLTPLTQRGGRYDKRESDKE